MAKEKFYRFRISWRSPGTKRYTIGIVASGDELGDELKGLLETQVVEPYEIGADSGPQKDSWNLAELREAIDAVAEPLRARIAELEKQIEDLAAKDSKTEPAKTAATAEVIELPKALSEVEGLNAKLIEELEKLGVMNVVDLGKFPDADLAKISGVSPKLMAHVRKQVPFTEA